MLEIHLYIKRPIAKVFIMQQGSNSTVPSSPSSEMDDYEFVDQFQLYAHEYPSLNEFTNPQYSTISPGETLQRSLSSESYTSSYPIFNHTRSSDCTTSTITDLSSDGLCEIFERPTMQIKPSPSPTSCFANLISFANSAYNPMADQGQVKHEEMISDGSIYGNVNNYYAPNESKRNPTPAKDHVIAERKRREKLNEKFIALSAIVPGLKKLDKASVIGDAIKYLKQLEEHVKLLEEQAKMKRPEESVFKTRLSIDHDDYSSCDESCVSEAILPDIEARVAEKNVLIRIHSKKKNGLLVKLLMELQNLHLNVVNSSVLPFGETALDITIVAQMDDEFSMRVKDLARNLQLAIS